MQIASFILINDRRLHQLEDQVEAMGRRVSSPQAAFANIVPSRLQEMGEEHPISIPFGSLLPLDQAAGRQHERLLSAFEDPARPSRLNRMAEAASVPMYYVSPGRVHDFVTELERLRLTHRVHPEDVETLLGRHVSATELPGVVGLLEQFQHDLYQVYRDAADAGKGVVVLVVNEPDDATSEDGFPRAA